MEKTNKNEGLRQFQSSSYGKIKRVLKKDFNLKLNFIVL